MSVFSIRRLIIPAILIVAAIMVREFILDIDPVYQQLLEKLPYITLGLTVALCIYFNRVRIFVLAVISIIIYYLIQRELQVSLDEFRAFFIFTSISISLPLTLLLLYYLPERGLRNIYGVMTISILPIQILLALFIFRYFPEAVLINELRQNFSIKPVDNYLLSVNASIGFAVVMLIGMINLHKYESETTVAILSVLSLSFITLALFHLQNISLVMYSAAGIILIISILQSSHAMAYRDELTGLLGRRALNERLKSLGRRYVIAMMDVDHFKKFNDTFGHDIGDDVLKMVARHIDAVKGGGKAYRYGGEEFCIIFPGKIIDECIPCLEDVRMNIQNYSMVVRDTKNRKISRKVTRERRGRRVQGRNGKSVSVTISIGVAELDGKHSRADDVLKAADTALYKAKQNGRNCLST